MKTIAVYMLILNVPLHVLQQVIPKRPSRTSCGCSRQCFDRLSESCRKGLFDNFWKTNNFDLQNAYLYDCVKVLTRKRKYTKAKESCRHFYRVFYEQNGSTVSHNVFVKQHFF